MESPEARVDALFAPWNRLDSPGAAVVVVRDGLVILQRGYGCAHLEYGVPITPRTVFHVASVSKQFTAMAALLLQQDGKVSLQDDVRRYVPELPDYGRTITLEHLIHHTSGLRETLDLLILAGWRMSDLVTNTDALDAAFRQTRLNFSPGDEQSYTNTGYILLATVIERVSGRTLREFTTERMFTPLGMRNTFFNDDHTRIVPNRASAYAPQKDGLAIAVPTFDTVGSTGLLTTAEDLVKWDNNLYDGRAVGGEALVRWMQTPATLNSGVATHYGAGLYMLPYRGLRTVQHAGGDAGYSAQFTRFPDQRLSVILLSNLATLPADLLAPKVADIFLEDTLAPLPLAYLPSTQELASEAGLYWSPLGQTTLRLEVREGVLVAGLGGGAASLEFVSPTRAQAPAAFAEIEFALAEQETVPRLQLQVGPFAPMEYERVAMAVPTPEALAEYAGEFSSAELQATLGFCAIENGLILSRRKYPDAPLAPTFADHFVLGGHDIAFGRDVTGRVSHLEVHSQRSRHMRFWRTG